MKITTVLLSLLLLISPSLSAMGQPDSAQNPIMTVLNDTFSRYAADQADNYARGKRLFHDPQLPQDYTTAAHLLHIVATSPHRWSFTADAQIVLGQLYYYGYGTVPQNLSSAQSLFYMATQNSVNLSDNYKANLYLGRLAAEATPPNFEMANMHVGPVQDGLTSLDTKTQSMLQAHIDYIKGLSELRLHNNFETAETHFQNILTNRLAGSQTKIRAQSLLTAIAEP